MSHAPGHTVSPPLFFDEPEDAREFSRKISLVVREILNGKVNTAHELTLTPNATETRLPHARASTFTVALMSPRSASAAAAMASGTVYYSSTKGEVTIHHDSQPDTDRVLGVVLLG